MMKPVLRVDGTGACPVSGRPVADGAKLAWNGGMLLVALLFAIPMFSWSALALFAVTTYFSLLIGHSVGMHRLMIHRTFKCSKPVEYALIYIGTLVGVAGPHGIIRVHDIRDWAQRQPQCHPFFAHRRSLGVDLWWQLTHRFEFDSPPTLNIEPHFANDRFHIMLERTWRWQQLPIAILFYLAGGWAWVVWGICVRVIVSCAGHWTITYFCHNPGAGRWFVRDAAVQASNLPGMGLLTYGECWHNNHHAFPESARIGLERGQTDPGWWVIALLERMGLVHDVGRPRAVADREDLIEIPPYAVRPAAHRTSGR